MPQDSSITWTAGRPIVAFQVREFPGVTFWVRVLHARRSESPALPRHASIRLVIWSDSSEGVAHLDSGQQAVIERAARKTAEGLESALRGRLGQEIKELRGLSDAARDAAIGYLPPEFHRWLRTPIQTEWMAVQGASDQQGPVNARARVVGRQPSNMAVQLRVIVSLSRTTAGAKRCQPVTQLAAQHIDLMRAFAARLRLQGESVTLETTPQFVLDDGVEVVRPEQGPSSFGAARGAAPVKTGEERRTAGANDAAAAVRAMARRATELAAHAGSLTREIRGYEESPGGRTATATATATRRRRS